MKIFTYIIIALSLITIVFNATKINFEKPFEGESTIAIIGIVASFCAILIVTLYTVAKKVVEQTK
jgi:hypothetical protein